MYANLPQSHGKGTPLTAIRTPAVAGTFYPADRDLLGRQLSLFLSGAVNQPAAALPKAIIGPHAGYAYSGATAARAYARLTSARGRISRVVLIGPSHYVPFRGLAADTTDAWAMPSGMVQLDTLAIAQLRALSMIEELDAAFEREHALEVHVPFLQHVLGEFRLVPIVAGEAAAEAVAAVFDVLWGGPETLIVVSTDLSHFLDYAACRRVDQSTARAIERFDVDALGPDQACGWVPTRGLLLAARRRGMAIERLDLRCSGDTAGPRDRVVGYGAWALCEDSERAEIAALAPTLVELARQSIMHGLDTGEALSVTADAQEMPRLAAPGAAFVTLRRCGTLRGCIGSAVATRALVVDVAQHAFNAAFRDPRFPRVDWLELGELSLSVSVLTPPEPIWFESEPDLLAQLRSGVDGLTLEYRGRHALLLPSVWEEIADRRQFLAALKLKAGLQTTPLGPGMRVQRFRSIEVKGTMANSTHRVAGRLGWTVIGRA
jgi:AmmeMemoRadiSam system protein B/AmmeMemoRadiSam system protein A